MSNTAHATPVPITTSRATLDDLAGLAVLFDAYRVFYGRASDASTARAFLSERLQHGESVIFVAHAAADHAALGFTQLYPSFSSVSARPSGYSTTCSLHPPRGSAAWRMR